MHAWLFARGAFASERIFLRSGGFQGGLQPRNLLGAEPRSDVADINQVVAAVHAGHQRPELASAAVPCADNHLMSGAAFRLRPGIAATRGIRRIYLLRDDTF